MSGKEISRLFRNASRRASRKTLASGGAITVQHGRKIVKKTARGIVSTISVKPAASRKVKKHSYHLES